MAKTGKKVIATLKLLIPAGIDIYLCCWTGISLPAAGTHSGSGETSVSWLLSSNIYLWQNGVNIRKFVKDFSEYTQLQPIKRRDAAITKGTMITDVGVQYDVSDSGISIINNDI